MNLVLESVLYVRVMLWKVMGGLVFVMMNGFFVYVGGVVLEGDGRSVVLNWRCVNEMLWE